ncbi:MAG: hypothetical protein VX642_10475 [Bdellovibrionota bacterium]|nr:hypothetical protein [Bdellovibrionota bacterium]
MKNQWKGAVSLIVLFSGLSLFAGNKSGNGDYCIQQGSKCVRVNFEGDVIHPKGKALKSLIRGSELPLSLKNEMLLDLDRTLVIFSEEVIKVSELLSRYYMQVVSRETETVTNQDGTETRTVRVREEWKETSKANDYGIFVSEQIGFKAGDIDSLYVRAVTESGPLGRVIYFTELMKEMSDDEIMKLVLHEQAHRLSYIGKLKKDERFAESWASTVLNFLQAEISKERFENFLIASGLDKGDSIRFENEEIDAKDPSLHHARISMQFRPEQFVAQGIQEIRGRELDNFDDYFNIFNTELFFQLEQGAFPGIDFLNNSPQIVRMRTTSELATESLAYAKELLFSGKPCELKVTYKQTSTIKDNQIFNNKKIQSIEIVDTKLERLKSLVEQEMLSAADTDLKIILSNGIEFSSLENFDEFYFEFSKALLLLKEYLSARAATDEVVKAIIKKFFGDGVGVVVEASSYDKFVPAEYFYQLGRKFSVLTLNPSGNNEDYFNALKEAYDTKINEDYEFVKNALKVERIRAFKTSYGINGLSMPLNYLDSKQEEDWVFGLLLDSRVKEKISCLLNYLPGKQLKIDFVDITYDSNIRFNYDFNQTEISFEFSLPSNGFENEPEKLKKFFRNEMLGGVFLQYKKKRDGFTDYDYKIFHKAKWDYKKKNYAWTSELQYFDGHYPMRQVNVDMLNAARKCK